MILSQRKQAAKDLRMLLSLTVNEKPFTPSGKSFLMMNLSKHGNAEYLLSLTTKSSGVFSRGYLLIPLTIPKSKETVIPFFNCGIF